METENPTLYHSHIDYKTNTAEKQTTKLKRRN